MRKIFTAMILPVCMIISLISGFFAVYAEDETHPDGSLPVVYLNIDESQGTIDDMIASGNHSVYCYGTVRIEVPEGFHYSDYPDLPCETTEDLAMTIRGRGNSTWQKADKKAFKIKLDDKTDLFGFGKNKHWVLLANALDETLLRDRITAWLGSQLGFAFTPMGVPVDVVIRGEEYGEHYLGSYYFSENVRVDKNRLEIDELSEEDTDERTITGAYLLQHGLQVNSWSPDRFFTERGVLWATHTPSFDVEGDTLTDEPTEPLLEESYAGTELADAYESSVQQKYIQEYMQKVEDTIYEGGTAYRDLFDLESAALYWWVQEFSLNADSYRTGSYYVYKMRDTDDGVGKIYSGPLWDFDYAWDNRYAAEGFSANHAWLYPMFRDFEEGGFVDELKKQWPRFREQIVKMIEQGGLIDGYCAETKNSAMLDRQIWHPEETDFDYQAEVDELKDWIIRRLAWVDENLDELNNVVNTLTFLVDEEVYDYRYLPHGERTDTLLEPPVKEGYVFIGWEDENGEIAESEISVTQDTVLSAKYLRDDEVTHGEDIAFRKNNDAVSYGPHTSAYQIDYEVIPTDAVDQEVEWSVSDDSCTVDEYGMVRFQGPGEVTVYGKLKNGTVREFHLSIIEGETPVPESVIPLEETIAMAPGEWKQFIVDTVPSPAKILFYTYASDDESVVTVDTYGVLTAIGPGETKVHLTAESSWDGTGVCETEITVIVAEETEPEPAEIVYTVNSDQMTWQKGSTEPLTMTVKRSEEDETCFSHFRDVRIDDTVLQKEKDYTAVSGSTVITLKPEALETLAAGEHTVTAEFDDGSAAVNLTVTAKEIVPVPDTSDHSPYVWMICFIISMAVFVFAYKEKKTAV